MFQLGLSICIFIKLKTELRHILRTEISEWIFTFVYMYTVCVSFFLFVYLTEYIPHCLWNHQLEFSKETELSNMSNPFVSEAAPIGKYNLRTGRVKGFFGLIINILSTVKYPILMHNSYSTLRYLIDSMFCNFLAEASQCCQYHLYGKTL